MEERTKTNNVESNILSIDDVNYMLSIIYSKLSEKEKATKLYAFCNFTSLSKSITAYSNLNLDEVEKLNKIKKLYSYYDKKEYFDTSINRYKCSVEEFELKLEKINEIFTVLNSENNDYNKAEKLLSSFKNSTEFRRAYYFLIRFGGKDPKLDSARLALNNFDELLNKFIEYENNGIVDEVKDVLKVNDYIKNFDYAKFVLNYYIDSTEGKNETDFLQDLGIDKDTLDFCLQTIDELDVDLYNKYLEKKEINDEIFHTSSVEIISDLASGIKTGVLSDGTPFDLFEFVKRVPFKNDDKFPAPLFSFIKKNIPQYYLDVLNYMIINKLNVKGSFKILDLDTINQTRTTINEKEITSEDNEIIVKYLKMNNIPVISRTYFLVRNKYLNGEIDVEEVKSQKQIDTNREKKKTLIPSGKTK